jgi:hypothetical protein
MAERRFQAIHGVPSIAPWASPDADSYHYTKPRLILEARTCPNCGAILSVYNRDPVCAPCQRDIPSNPTLPPEADHTRKHGTHGTYCYGCRCWDCKLGESKYRRKWRADRKHVSDEGMFCEPCASYECKRRTA